jgi:hypothetical protein
MDHVGEDAPDSLGDGTLAVAGRPIEQDGSPGLYGGADLIEDFLR